jgi:hypothetical protein
MSSSRNLLAVAGAIVAAGCASTSDSSLPEFEPLKYGEESCEQKYRDRCARVSNKTLLGRGPLQVEYHSADGRSFLWIGDRLINGHWYIGSGPMNGGLICYVYQRGAPKCDGITWRFDKDSYAVVGDPYGLAGRSAAPFDLGSLPFRSTIEDVNRAYAPQSAPVPG